MRYVNDAIFDHAIQTELTHVQSIHDAVEEKAGHRADAHSDLAADEARFPEIWATSVAQRGLVHACECIEAAGALMLNWSWFYPQFALLRAAYESAGATVWLLSAEDTDTRLARLIYQHQESWRYSSRAFDGTPLDDNGEHQERQQWVNDVATRLQIDPRRGNPGGYEKLIKAIDDLPGHPESLLTAWQLCSGVSHAKTWALNTVTTEVESSTLYAHGTLSGRVPNSDLFLSTLRIARRSAQYAWALYQIRTTTRPHTLSLKTVQRDNDSGEEVSRPTAEG
ncbi:putative uncharacterized protein [Rhodococcus sp. AW25M09]|nr:putative uncharacterized protein [Rhodococcus sp. AW25M09]